MKHDVPVLENAIRIDKHPLGQKILWEQSRED